MGSWILIASLLVTVTGPEPRPTAADTVLVLDSGQALLVRSYEIKGDCVHIVSTAGQPLIMRAERIDFDASRVATEKRRKQLEAAEVRRAAIEAEAARRSVLARTARSMTLLEASREAIARGGRGGLSTAGSAPGPPGEAAPPEQEAAPPRTSGEIGSYDLAPGERKTFSLPTTEPLRIWIETTLSPEQAEKCSNFCVRLSSLDESQSVASPWKTGLALAPSDGRIQGLLENVESFPIRVIVYTE